MAVLLSACEREYDSPYLPGSGNYAGDEWTKDGDGNGVADSVEKYAPECGKVPRDCIETAKVLSRIGLGYSLTAKDMILWHGAAGAEPRLTWEPAEASVRGFDLSSSDTTKVRVKGGRLDAVGVGNVQVSVNIPGESRVASFIVKVVSKEGKSVVSVSARDLTLEAGKEGAPLLTWNPPDATYKEYTLSVDEPSVGWPVGVGNLKALFPGTAKVTVEAQDGGHKTAFTLKVTDTSQKIEAVSLSAEDMYIVAGAEAEAPVIKWNPHNVTEKRYLLVPVDTLVATVNKDRDKVLPLKKGKTLVNLFALDGSGKSAWFTANVVDTAIPVQGVAADDMRLPVGSAPAAPRLAWTPADATNRKFTLVSDNPAVASVEDGLVVPVSLGRALLTATTFDGGHMAGFLVDVLPKDTAIHVDSIKASDISLTVGASRAPILTWYPEDAGNREFTLSAANPEVASVSGGLVQGVKPGSTRITVTAADGGKTAEFQVNVSSAIIPVQGVQGSPMSLVVGQAEFPSLSWQPASATNQAYTLWSDNSNIVRIVDSVKVEGVAVGTANVHIRSKEGPADTIPVTVNALAVSVTAIQVANFELAAQDPDKDVSTLIQWTPANATVKAFKLISSSNATALTIVENKLRPLAAGTANVVVESQDASRARDTFTVTVRQPVKGVTVRDTSVWPGSADIDPAPLITWTPSNAENKSFTLASLDTMVASVVNGTKVRPKATGSALVVLRSVDNSTKQDTFRVTVMVPVQSLRIRDTTVLVGAKHVNPAPLVTWTPSNATDKNWFLTWAGTQTATIVDSVSWWFNAVGPGQVSLVYNSSQNPAAKDTFLITVIQPVTGVAAAPMTIKVGDADLAPVLTWTPANASDKGYTLTGGTAGIATVAPGGKVHAEGPGSASFTVKSNDGARTANLAVTVLQPVQSVSAAALSMKVGDPDAVPAVTFTPANASDKGWTLSGGTAGIATVVGGNKVHAEGPGQVTLTVKSNDGAKTGNFIVTVTQPVTGITVAAVTMNKGEADRDPVITWNPSNASNKEYKLSGGNGTVASVVGNKIHAIGGGTVGFIVTTADGSRTANFNVTVNVPVVSVQGQGTTMRVGDPDEYPQLTWTPADATNKGYTLTSSAPNNVQIIDGVRMRAVSSGDATITVTTADGQKKDTFVVDVRNGGFGD